jgi:hypothetical protein
MMGLRILFTVLAWMIWWGGLVFVIQMDQKGRAETEPTPVTKYVLLGLVCGSFVLPFYFWSTRKTASAALRGAAIGLGLALAAGFIAFVGSLMG